MKYYVAKMYNCFPPVIKEKFSNKADAVAYRDAYRHEYPDEQYVIMVVLEEE